MGKQSASPVSASSYQAEPLRRSILGNYKLIPEPSRDFIDQGRPSRQGRKPVPAALEGMTNPARLSFVEATDRNSGLRRRALLRFPMVAQQPASCFTPYLQRGHSALVVPNPDRLVDPRQENLAIADFPGARVFNYCLYRLVHKFIRQHRLQLYLRQQINRVLPSAVKLRVPFLAAMPADFKHSHSLNPNLQQRVFHGIKPRRLNHRLDFC